MKNHPSEFRITVMDTPTFINLLMTNSLITEFKTDDYEIYTRSPRSVMNEGVTRNLKNSSVIVECMSKKKIFKVEAKTKTPGFCDKQDMVVEFTREHLENLEDYHAFNEL